MATKRAARNKYPKCREHLDGKHKFGVANLSFRDVCLYRDKDTENIFKCGFERPKREATHARD